MIILVCDFALPCDANYFEGVQSIEENLLLFWFVNWVLLQVGKTVVNLSSKIFSFHFYL